MQSPENRLKGNQGKEAPRALSTRMESRRDRQTETERQRELELELENFNTQG